MTILILLLVIFSVPLLYVVVSSVHEIGHACMGCLYGGKFIYMTIGPLTFGRNNEYGKFRLSINQDIRLYGGVVAVAPPDSKKCSPKQYCMYIWGGVMVSFIFGVILLLWAIYVWPLHPYYFAILFTICGMSLGIGISAIIPFKKRIVPFIFSDGRRLWEYKKKSNSFYMDYYVWKNNPAFSEFRKLDFNHSEHLHLKESDDVIYRFTGSYYTLLHYLTIRDIAKVTAEREIVHHYYQQLPKNEKRVVDNDKEFKQLVLENISK